MNNSYLIVYKHFTLYKILEELNQDLNFEITEAKDERKLKKKIQNLNNYIILAKKKISNLSNQLIFDNYPIKISKLIQNINIEFMKMNFSDQSKVNINNYVIDLNSREIFFGNDKLKLTEKEVNIIIYLSKQNKPVRIEELEKNVWQYQTALETHTVETHIYRLRKKFIKIFKDKNFILSKKNGYQIQ
tara:strand:- start:53 stop:616 length:564 start_codon:yes stop_codon:yes gene_type:complete